MNFVGAPRATAAVCSAIIAVVAESVVHLLERIALQCCEIVPNGGLITAAQGTGKRRTRSRKPAHDGYEIRQRLLARHSELPVELEEKLAPEKRGEVSSENAQRMVTLALLRLDEEARVWEPRDQRGQGRRALVDHERDALIELALIERSGKAEHGMRPNGQRACKAARKMDPYSFVQLWMRPNEGLDRLVADRQERARVRLHEHLECGATLCRLQAP